MMLAAAPLSPDARNSPPSVQVSLHTGWLLTARRTPVYAATKNPKTAPTTMNTFPRALLMTRPAPASTRQRRYPPSPTAARNITNEKRPKIVRPQAPNDIGEYALNTGVP